MSGGSGNRRLWPARPHAWQYPGFRSLTVAWFFANLADSALYLMAAVWAKELTGSDEAAGLVFFALWIPVVTAPFSGHLVDRMSRRRLLFAANALLVVAVLSLLLVSSADDVWIVYLVVLAYGSIGFLTAAAQSGLVRDLLGDDELAGGNGLLSTIDQGMRLFSPLVGTGLYALAGPGAVVGLTAGCFAVTALLFARLPVAETPPAPSAERGSYLTELLAGFRHLVRTPVLNTLTLAIAVGMAAYGITNVVVFSAMEQGLGIAPAMLGPISSLEGVGAVVGGITVAWGIGRWGSGRTVTVGLVLFGVGAIPLAGSSVAAVLAGAVVLGIGIPWMVVGFVTARQRLTPAVLQGRAAAASNVAANLPQALVTLAAAGLVGVVDYRILIAVMVTGILAAGALAARA